MGQIAELKVRIKLNCDVHQIGFAHLKETIAKSLLECLQDDGKCDFSTSVAGVKVKNVRALGQSLQIELPGFITGMKK